MGRRTGRPRKNPNRRAAPSDSAIAKARKDAHEQVQRRDARAVQMRKLRELEAIESVLDDLDHPVWWAISFLLLPHVGERAGESAHDSVVRIARDNAETVREAFAAARAPFLLTVIERLSGSKAAEENETEKQALTRILIERGASSYAAVRIAGEYGDRVHSAGLPSTEARAVRRLGARIMASAAKKHAALVGQVVAHAPIVVGPPLDHIKDGLLVLLDGALRKEEKQQVEIVRSIDKHRRRKPSPSK